MNLEKCRNACNIALLTMERAGVELGDATVSEVAVVMAAEFERVLGAPDNPSVVQHVDAMRAAWRRLDEAIELTTGLTRTRLAVARNAAAKCMVRWLPLVAEVDRQIEGAP